MSRHALPTGWAPSDYPHGLFHLDMNGCAGRVRPIPHIRYWEWSSWVGPCGKRVLHARSELKSRSAAMQAAEKSCAAIVGKR